MVLVGVVCVLCGISVMILLFCRFDVCVIYTLCWVFGLLVGLFGVTLLLYVMGLVWLWFGFVVADCFGID